MFMYRFSDSCCLHSYALNEMMNGGSSYRRLSVRMVTKDQVIIVSEVVHVHLRLKVYTMCILDCQYWVLQHTMTMFVLLYPTYAYVYSQLVKETTFSLWKDQRIGPLKSSTPNPPL